MPEIDGFELADMMRQHPRFQKTAIIFISAVHLTDPDRIKGYQSGAVDYISVPVVPELLRAKVSVFTELIAKRGSLNSSIASSSSESRSARSSCARVSEQLEQRFAELETIMQVLPVGVAVSQDPGCEVITGNAALNQILGAELGENLSLAGTAADKRSFRIYQDGRELIGQRASTPACGRHRAAARQRGNRSSASQRIDQPPSRQCQSVPRYRGRSSRRCGRILRCDWPQADGRSAPRARRSS